MKLRQRKRQKDRDTNFFRRYNETDIHEWFVQYPWLRWPGKTTYYKTMTERNNWKIIGPKDVAPKNKGFDVIENNGYTIIDEITHVIREARFPQQKEPLTLQYKIVKLETPQGSKSVFDK